MEIFHALTVHSAFTPSPKSSSSFLKIEDFLKFIFKYNDLPMHSDFFLLSPSTYIIEISFLFDLYPL